jgi:LPS export ABC transporter protein LptC
MTKSNKIRQLLALLVVVASLSLAAVIVVKVYQGRETKDLLRKLPKNIDVSLQKIHYTETKDGVKKWDLVADKADYEKRLEITHLSGIRLVVAGGGTTGDITLTAPRADYHNISRDVTLDGKVVAKSASGMEFTANGASYIAARSVILTSSRVRFTDGKLTLEGVGMEFTPETKNVRLLNNVTAHFIPGASK